MSLSKDKTKLTLDEFPLQSYDKLRYGDTDRQGHVNNAVFATCFETGRCELLYDPAKPMAAANGSFVIANLNLDYLAEIHWPGRVDIGTGVVKLGNSSLRLFQALFQDGRCVATAETVIVHMDDESHASSPLTESTREALGRYLID